MLPVGTRVIVLATDHLPARLRRPARILGRIGTVVAHDGDGPDAPNIVAGLSWLERLMGFWCFPDRALAAVGAGDPVSLPRWIPVAGYWASDAAAPDSDAAA